MKLKQMAKTKMALQVENHLNEGAKDKRMTNTFCPWPYLIYAPKKPDILRKPKND